MMLTCEHCGETRNTDAAYTSPANQVRDARLWKEQHVSGACVGIVKIPEDPEEREVLEGKLNEQMVRALEYALRVRRESNEAAEKVIMASKRLESFHEQTKVLDEAALTELAEAAWTEHSIGMLWETDSAEYGEHRMFVDGWVRGRMAQP
ncbi:hypothetical protein SEA_RASPUTIA_27 [Microbacterium phage Rasputia]|nr:hypothetical protein SEA_RASPUTIA_27 [Microbacterium phage Rasputia]